MKAERGLTSNWNVQDIIIFNLLYLSLAHNDRHENWQVHLTDIQGTFFKYSAHCSTYHKMEFISPNLHVPPWDAWNILESKVLVATKIYFPFLYLPYWIPVLFPSLLQCVLAYVNTLYNFYSKYIYSCSKQK